MMKKLLLLSLTLILSWNSFSQIVTPIRDTTRVTLSTEVARKVAVDLVEGDKAKKELELRLQEIDTLKTINFLQDSLILLKANEIESLSKIVDIKTVEDQEKQQRIEELNKDLRKQITLKSTFATTTGVTVVALIVSLLIGN